MKEYDFRTVSLLQVLANPIRYQILKALEHGENTVTELALMTGREVPNISQHLRILRQQNLVRFRTEKNQVYYQLKKGEILSILYKVNDFVRRKL